MAKTFEQIAEFLSIIVKSVTESYVFRLFSAMASQKTTQELSEESNIATLVLGWTGFGNGFTDCCNLGGSRNNLMKQRILYFFFIREQCHWIYYGQCDKPPRKLLRCWWANDSNFHHKSGQITKGSPPWLSSTSPRTSKNSSATLQYPGRSPYRAFYSFCSCRFIGKVSSVPAHNVWINVKLLHLQII